MELRRGSNPCKAMKPSGLAAHRALAEDAVVALHLPLGRCAGRGHARIFAAGDREAPVLCYWAQDGSIGLRSVRQSLSLLRVRGGPRLPSSGVIRACLRPSQGVDHQLTGTITFLEVLG